MLDPRNFARRGFAAGSLSVAVQFFAMFGFLFLALPYLQLVLGYSPLQAAGALVPMALVVIPLSRVAPAVAARFGIRIAGATGLSLMALGFLVLATLEVGSSYAHFLAGLLPFGAGMALAGAPGDDCDRGVAPAGEAGRRLGRQRRLARARRRARNRGARQPDEQRLPRRAWPTRPGRSRRTPPSRRDGSLAAAQRIGEQLGPQGQQLVLHAQAAFVDGFTRGLVGGAALLLRRSALRRRPRAGARRVSRERDREADRRGRHRGRPLSRRARRRARGWP